MDTNIKEKMKRFKEQQESTCDTLYSVTYIKSAGNYGEICPRRGESPYYITRELTLINVNGYGIGTVFFVNKDDKLVVLPWSAIISMIPVEEKEISNYAR